MTSKQEFHEKAEMASLHDENILDKQTSPRSLSLAPTVGTRDDSVSVTDTGDKPAESKTDADNGDGHVLPRQDGETAAPDANDQDEPPYSAFEEGPKIAIMISAGFMAITSPLSSAIYYPAIGDIAHDLGVTPSLVNLSITTYMILQAIAPSFVASFSDVYGRRPAYIYCYIVFLGACIGLSVQNSYAALLVLRCLQSAGGSGTIALGSAVVADLSTRAERGKYMAYASLPTTVGPAFGPLIGGVLNQYGGWRWIFRFLSILSGVLLLYTIFVMPETCRAVVGNGSIPAPRWNRSLMAIIKQRRDQKKGILRPYSKPDTSRRRRPNPLLSVKIVSEKQAGILLAFTGLTNAGYFVILSTLTTQLAEDYHLDSLQIGLCYLPIGLGSMACRWVAGTLIDRNFRRWAKKVGMEINTKKQQDISNFPIEKARLEVQIPMVYLSAVAFIVYGWVFYYHTNLAGPLVVLFFLGLGLSSCNSCLNTLLVDTHRESPATASAASNLVRCLFSAGATGFALPLINAIGFGWTGVLVSLLWIALSPLLWVVYFKGLKWRQQQAAKVEARKAAKAAALEAAAHTTEVNIDITEKVNQREDVKKGLK